MRKMRTNRRPLSVLLAVVLYGLIFVIRKHFGILTWSGAVDWLVLIVFAALPSFLHKESALRYHVAMFAITAVLEVAVTAVLVVTVFSEWL